MQQMGRVPILKTRLNELLGNSSITEFAKKLGMSRQTLGFYLNGDRIPDAEMLIQICERCQVSSDWLLGLSEEPDMKKPAADELGLSAKAVKAMLDLNTENKEMLSQMLCFPEFINHLEQLQTMKNDVQDAKLAAAKDFEAAISDSDLIDAAALELRAKLGYAVHITTPQGVLEYDRAAIRGIADVIAVYLTGYNEMPFRYWEK